MPAAILSDAIEGEARDVGRVHAAHRAGGGGAGAALRAARGDPVGRRDDRDAARQGAGRAEQRSFCWPLALAAEGVPFAALAADTDGIDGSEDNAGAFADGASAARLRAAGLDPAALLAANDAWGAFDAAGRSVRDRADGDERERFPGDPASGKGGASHARDVF